ncbi:hypothetical protein BGX24_012141 [Mortierella sp. AD032]|nr:hypothetical protein BGX24_012141 [Mortierella sp. AD032]
MEIKVRSMIRITGYASCLLEERSGKPVFATASPRHRSYTAPSQNDIGVLNHLDKIYRDEPDEDTLSAIQETINNDESKSQFLEYSVGHIDDIDEDDEETEDEKKDLDYEFSDASLLEISNLYLTMIMADPY